MSRSSIILIGALAALFLAGSALLYAIVSRPENFEGCVECGTETMAVRVFFVNDRLDPEITCTRVFPVERVVPKTAAVAQAALGELFRGPTGSELIEGYGTAIPEGVVVQSLSVVDGVANADFSADLERGVAGSCRVTAVRAQIAETLQQFPTVREVVLSIDGRIEDILQP